MYSFYLAGQWLTSAKVIEVCSPFDQRVIARVSVALPEDVEQVLENGATGIWSNSLTVTPRGLPVAGFFIAPPPLVCQPWTPV